jgi:hypothetical protein
MIVAEVMAFGSGFRRVPSPVEIVQADTFDQGERRHHASLQTLAQSASYGQSTTPAGVLFAKLSTQRGSLEEFRQTLVITYKYPH